jgi:hypothetical protein
MCTILRCYDVYDGVWGMPAGGWLIRYDTPRFSFLATYRCLWTAAGVPGVSGRYPFAFLLSEQKLLLCSVSQQLFNTNDKHTPCLLYMQVTSLDPVLHAIRQGWTILSLLRDC